MNLANRMTLTSESGRLATETIFIERIWYAPSRAEGEQLVDRVVALAPADSGKLPQPGVHERYDILRNVNPPSRLARSSPDRLGRDRFPAQQTADDADELLRRANAIRRPEPQCAAISGANRSALQ